jgi:hypothetical protein
MCAWAGGRVSESGGAKVAAAAAAAAVAERAAAEGGTVLIGAAGGEGLGDARGDARDADGNGDLDSPGTSSCWGGRKEFTKYGVYSGKKGKKGK